MPVVAKGFVVVALQLFGNEFVFELTNLFGGQNRILDPLSVPRIRIDLFHWLPTSCPPLHWRFAFKSPEHTMIKELD